MGRQVGSHDVLLALTSCTRNVASGSWPPVGAAAALLGAGVSLSLGGGEPHLCQDRAAGLWGAVLPSLLPGSEPGPVSILYRGGGWCVPASLCPSPSPDINRCARGQASEHLQNQCPRAGEKVASPPTHSCAHAAQALSRPLSTPPSSSATALSGRELGHLQVVRGGAAPCTWSSKPHPTPPPRSAWGGAARPGQRGPGRRGCHSPGAVDPGSLLGSEA